MNRQFISIAEFNRLLDKEIANECSEDEKVLFNVWFQKLIDHNVLFAHADNTMREERMLSEILKKTEIAYLKRTENVSSNTRWLTSKFTTLAAGVLFVVVFAGVLLFYSLRNESTTDYSNYAANHSTNLNEKGYHTIINTSPTFNKQVNLSDGSVIELHPASKIEFKEPFENQRNIRLVGEAFFTVKRDVNHPFLVYANGLVTKVLGTSFTIKSLPNTDETIVDVKTGLVAVFREGKSLTNTVYKLTPNYELVFDKNANSIITKLQENPQVVLSKEEISKMKFDEVPAAEIFKALEKAYEVELSYDSEAIKNCKLTMQLNTEGLYDRLKIICRIMNADYETIGTTVYIKTRGCN